MVTEDTTKDLEEMLREAEEAPEPGESVKEKVIHKPDEDLPVPMIRGTLESAGYVYIYDTNTGDRSLANRNMLRQLLHRKRPDGSHVFTTIRPVNPPNPIKRGTYKCLLHPDDPNRGHYAEMGFPTCPKSNLTSPFMVKKHMKNRHKVEWAAIEEERKEAKEVRAQKAQEALIKAATKQSKK